MKKLIMSSKIFFISFYLTQTPHTFFPKFSSKDKPEVIVISFKIIFHLVILDIIAVMIFFVLVEIHMMLDV